MTAIKIFFVLGRQRVLMEEVLNALIVNLPFHSKTIWRLMQNITIRNFLKILTLAKSKLE